MKLRTGLRNRIDEFSFNYVKDQTLGGQLLEENLIAKAQTNAQQIQRQGMTTQDLWEVAYWKREVGSKMVLDTPDSHTKSITKQAFETQDDWEKIVLLRQRQLKGIGESKASAILHFYDIEEYPIIDRHALWSVGLERKLVCDETLWREFVLCCREAAKEYSVDMRKLDRALWRFSYEDEQR